GTTRHTGSTCPAWSCSQARPPTLATAATLGTLSAPQSLSQIVGGVDQADYYKFTLAADARVSVRVSGLSEGVTVGLIADRDGNGSIDFYEMLAEFNFSSQDDSSFSQEVSAGTYYVRVVPLNGDGRYGTAYKLDLSSAALPGSPSADPGSTLA